MKTEGDEGTRLVGGGSFMERPMVTDQTGISRRTAIGRGLAGLAGLAGLLVFPGQVLAKALEHDDSFVILLKGHSTSPWSTGPTSASPRWT